MDKDDYPIAFKSILDDCLRRIEEKEYRMIIYFNLDYPGFQRAETIDRMLSPIMLLTPRYYTEKNRKQVVEKQLANVMGKYYIFRDECKLELSKLEKGDLDKEEIGKKIIRYINLRDHLFQPTVADLQMADMLGDLEKYGYEAVIDNKGKRILRKSAL
jgi:hypothetical protein